MGFYMRDIPAIRFYGNAPLVIVLHLVATTDRAAAKVGIDPVVHLVVSALLERPGKLEGKGGLRTGGDLAAFHAQDLSGSGVDQRGLYRLAAVRPSEASIALKGQVAALFGQAEKAEKANSGNANNARRPSDIVDICYPSRNW